MFFKIFNNIINKLVGLIEKKSFAYVICALSVVLSLFTYFNFSKYSFVEKRNAFAILYVDFTFILLVFFLVGYKIFNLIYKNKNGKSGSKFQIKLITIFGVLVCIPSFIMAIFAMIFFHGGMDAWFTERNKTVLNESLKVAESYLKEHQKVIANDAMSLANMLELKLPLLPRYDDVRDNFLNTLIQMKSLEDAILFDEEQNIIARSEYSYSLEFSLIKSEDISKAIQNGVTLIDTGDHQYVTALASIDIYDSSVFKNNGNSNDDVNYLDKNHHDVMHAFLLVRRHVDKDVISYIDNTKNAVLEYTSIQSKRANIEASFVLIFFLVAMLLVLSAIGIAITLGSKIVEPIGDLIDATKQIRDGNYDVKVANNSENEDMNVLNNTFNDMATTIKEQHNSLKQINDDLDSRIQFIENVLYGVSSGVVGLDCRRKIYIYNKLASDLFDLSNGTNIENIIPDISQLLDEAFQKKEKIIDSDITVNSFNSIRLLYVKVIFVKNLNGYIITFDDMTEMRTIQKKAAWSDVARRVAHEIKNPLTPIQLAIERILRKFESEVSNKALLKDLTRTIINQVEIIGRLINEFSLFSRMPEPVFSNNNVVEILSKVIFLQKNSYNHINFKIDTFSNDVFLNCDEKLISQAFMNIIKNSINAINYELSNNKSQNKKYEICVKLRKRSDDLLILFEDNGPGFPEEYKDKLTEQYFSLIPNGTGLGLSIVEKIIADHYGKIEFNNLEHGGASVAITFPIKNYI